MSASMRLAVADATYPSRSCPRPYSCFYCRWCLRCPIHAGEAPSLKGRERLIAAESQR